MPDNFGIDGGIFELKTTVQLFRKLESDYEQVVRTPADSHAWFNFFVTADHIADWYCDGDETRANRLRNTQEMLRVCHHLCINAKHYKLNRKSPPSNLAGTNYVEIVRLNEHPPEQRRFALQINSPASGAMVDVSALELAEWLVEFWRDELRDELAAAAKMPDIF